MIFSVLVVKRVDFNQKPCRTGIGDNKMDPNKCYCRIENPGYAYCFIEDCPIHGDKEVSKAKHPIRR